MTVRAPRIAVLQPAEDSALCEVAGAVAEALAAPEEESTQSPPRTSEPALHEADIAVVFEPIGFEQARQAGVRFVAIVLPSFDLGWAGPIEGADCVLVAHTELKTELVRRGVTARRIEVCGPVAPKGFCALEDLAGGRRDAGLAADDRTVVVPAAALEEEGPNPLLVQLSLVAVPVTWVFDVGSDEELAGLLRRLVPIYGLSAFMFADAEASRGWSLADAALVRVQGPEVLRALASGASLIALDPKREDTRAPAAALQSSGVAQLVDTLATLAVTTEDALATAALERSRQAVRDLDPWGSSGRIAPLLRSAWEQRRDDRSVAPAGLPVGLERLSERGAVPRPTSSKPAPTIDPIEAELAALKKRL